MGCTWPLKYVNLFHTLIWGPTFDLYGCSFSPASGGTTKHYRSMFLYSVPSIII